MLSNILQKRMGGLASLEEEGAKPLPGAQAEVVETLYDDSYDDVERMRPRRYRSEEELEAIRRDMKQREKDDEHRRWLERRKDAGLDEGGAKPLPGTRVKRKSDGMTGYRTVGKKKDRTWSIRWNDGTHERNVPRGEFESIGDKE